MANRRSAMYQYRQVMTRIRLGESDRAIGRSVLGCPKARACPLQSGDIGQAIRNSVSA